MDNRLVSIIVPVFNAEEYIDFCVESLVTQSYSNLEIILVNDGSIDSSAELCENWAMKDNRIHVLHQKNLGVSIARNRGIEYSSGKWIMFVDADDVINNELVENLVNTVIEMNTKTACSDYKRFVNDDELQGEIKTETSTTIFVSAEELKKLRQGFFCWGILFDKEILDNNCLRFDSELKNLEDVYFLSMYFLFVKNISYIKKKSYYYRITKGSITSNCIDVRWQINSWNKCLNAFNKYLIKKDLTADQYASVLKVRRHCINNLWNECLSVNYGYRESVMLMRNFTVIPFQRIGNLKTIVYYLGELVHKRIPILEFIIYVLLLNVKKRDKKYFDL